MRDIRTFTQEGLVKVTNTIEALTTGKMVKGGQGVKISDTELSGLMKLVNEEEILEPITDPDNSAKIDEKKIFETSYEMAKYLYGITSSVVSNQFHKDGTWTWLAILFLEQILRKNKLGEIFIGDSVRYVLREEKTLRYYRHLVYMPHLVFSKHKEDSKIFINSPPHISGEFIGQAQKPILLSNVNLIKMLNKYFYDESTGKFSKGFTKQSAEAPGALRRLVQISLLQMMVNFDVFETEPDRLFDLLPDDFKKVALIN